MIGWRRRPRGILGLVEQNFDLRPAAIIDHLELCRPRYGATAAYRHFGQDEAGFSWERTDKVDFLRRQAGLG